MSRPKIFPDQPYTAQVLNLDYPSHATNEEIQAFNDAILRAEKLHDHPAAVRLEQEESLHVRAIRVGLNDDDVDPEMRLVQLTWLDTGCSTGAVIVMTPDQAETLTKRLWGALQAGARGHEDVSLHHEIEDMP